MNALRARWSTLKGLWRSLRVYHGDRAHHRAMDALYGRFIIPGDLAFDIGAHVGDRVSSFRRCGAKVVALEPQPACARFIRLLHGRDRHVTLVEAAVGSRAGEIILHVNSANPTVSTASADFVRAADGARGWEGQAWDREITVPATTLDALIAAHGVPSFIKIDVEGFEIDVLNGLSHAVPALSFEFTTIARDVAMACLDRCAALGYRRFNVALGETQEMSFATPVDAGWMAEWIAALPHEANSGDVYAMMDEQA